MLEDILSLVANVYFTILNEIGSNIFDENCSYGYDTVTIAKKYNITEEMIISKYGKAE